MGDVPPPSAPASEYATQQTSSGAYQGMSPSDGQPNNPAFQPSYQQFYGPSPSAFTNQFDMTQAQNAGRQGPYNMTAMANSLPQSGYRTSYGPSQQQQRYTGSVPNMMPQMAHYAGQSSMSQLNDQQYYMAQQSQMAPYYNAQMSPTSQHQPSQPGSLSPRHNMNIGFYPNPVIMNQQQPLHTGYYYHASNHYPAATSTVHGQVPHVPYLVPDDTPGGLREPSPSQGNGQGGSLISHSPNDDASGNQPNAVRGPPRKPRQSGHAIWIGNLPPQTDLMNLVHHVCREAAGLESLFLISKSNCAFANFKDEQSCIAAQQKLHDSKFQSVRLVSRLRKSTVEGATGQTAPTGPAATSSGGQNGPTDSAPSPQAPAIELLTSTSDVPPETKNKPTVEVTAQKDKFFILKSLTVEDLESSVRDGVWATQSHNEETLNNAFKTVDNVYLVFSANKSGEYFGFARMRSPINNDPAAAIEFAPKAQATTNSDLPKAIPTEATESCPRGRIIDDSARGTIFWEVEREEADGVPETESEDSVSVRSAQEEGNPKAWGKPFKLEWLSTTRLPFYRTRGLRNPWNSNREVKIARDGTELEPSAGKRLIGLFNRVQSPAPLAMGIRPNIAMTAGYPPAYRQ